MRGRVLIALAALTLAVAALVGMMSRGGDGKRGWHKKRWSRGRGPHTRHTQHTRHTAKDRKAPRQQCSCPVCTAAAVSPSMAAVTQPPATQPPATRPPTMQPPAVMQPPQPPAVGVATHQQQRYVTGYQPVLGSAPPPPTPSPISPTQLPSYASIDMFASPDF